MSRTRTMRVSYLVLAGICIIGTAATFDPQSRDVIRVVANGSPQDEDYHGARAFRETVESLSGGEMVVDIFPDGQFCSSARECIDFMEVGLLDVFMTTGGGLGNTFGPGQIIEAPYVFPTDAVAECVLDGPFRDYLRDAALDAGLRIRLMVIGNTGGWRSFATTDEQIRVPEDLAGAKIRTTSARMQQLFVRQFGASPTPISWSELYVAMSTGVVDGTTNSLPDIVAANLHEQIDYITLDNHGYMGAMWWLSGTRWSSLSEEEKRIMTTAFERLKIVTRQKAKENESRARRVFVESGGEIIDLLPAQRADFIEEGSAIRPWFSERYGDEWFERLDAAIADCQAPGGGNFEATLQVSGKPVRRNLPAADILTAKSQGKLR